jgi:hypothetical protein
VREHGTIEDILKARLKMAVEVRQREHALVLLQHHVAVTLQCDLVHGVTDHFKTSQSGSNQNQPL